MPCICFLLLLRVLIILFNHRHHCLCKSRVLLALIVVGTPDGKLVQEYLP